MTKITVFNTDTQLAKEYLQQNSASTLSDSLADNKTRLENKLKQQLELPIDDADIALIQSIISKLLESFSANESGLSRNTIKSLHASWGVFYQWCKTNHCNALPASVDDFSRFMHQMKSEVKLNTLSSYRWAINTLHMAAGLPSPTQSVTTKDSFKGIRKEKARQSELISQASAFRNEHLEALINIWRKSTSMLTRRNLAIMCVGYESMLRESEIARIRFEHLSVLDDGRAELLIPTTKTNHSGEPDIVLLSRQCVSIIYDYLDEVTQQTEYLFKPLKRDQSIIYDVKPLTRLTIDRVFKLAYQTMINHHPDLCRTQKVWSGHSARVGACQDLLSSGFSILEVQQAGRWSSPMMVYRYGRNILARESAMAKARWDKE